LKKLIFVTKKTKKKQKAAHELNELLQISRKKLTQSTQRRRVFLIFVSGLFGPLITLVKRARPNYHELFFKDFNANKIIFRLNRGDKYKTGKDIMQGFLPPAWPTF